LFVKYDGSQSDPVYSDNLINLDLGSIVPSLSGPKRPQDRVSLTDLPAEFKSGLTAKIGFKGYGLAE
jgi:aconitate hydratase